MEGFAMCSIFFVVIIAFSDICQSFPFTTKPTLDISHNGATSGAVLQALIAKFRQEKCDVLLKITSPAKLARARGDVITNDSWLQYCNTLPATASATSLSLCQELVNLSTEICLSRFQMGQVDEQLIKTLNSSVRFLVLDDKIDICLHFTALNEHPDSFEAKLGQFAMKHQILRTLMFRPSCESICKNTSAENACKVFYTLTALKMGQPLPQALKPTEQPLKKTTPAVKPEEQTMTSGEDKKVGEVKPTEPGLILTSTEIKSNDKDSETSIPNMHTTLTLLIDDKTTVPSTDVTTKPVTNPNANEPDVKSDDQLTAKSTVKPSGIRPTEKGTSTTTITDLKSTMETQKPTGPPKATNPSTHKKPDNVETVTSDLKKTVKPSTTPAIKKVVLGTKPPSPSGSITRTGTMMQGFGDPDDLEDDGFYTNTDMEDINYNAMNGGDGFLDTPEKSESDVGDGGLREPVEGFYEVDAGKKTGAEVVPESHLDTKDLKLPPKHVVESSHFMAYFLTIVVVCIVGYVLFHNKQKIIAFILEGRGGSQRRRQASSGGPEYRKLSSNVDEVLPAADKKVTTQNYIY